MSGHQALYRKWRPKTFSEVCGQDHITSVLKYEVANAKVSHAYLFCGSRGTGKTTCAKILARAVNCENPVNGDPCGVCESCLAIGNDAATDIIEMDAASNNGVDYIRDIRDEVVYTPAMLKYRVYIIDEVHMLSSGAFNALLKTLEEPPAHVIFILATTELQKIPATILSRCQRFDFRRITTGVIASRLKFIAGEEGITVSDEAVSMLSRLAAGGMRDAVSLLELCAGEGKPIDAKTVVDIAGISGREMLSRTVRAVLDANYEEIFSVIGSLYASSKDLGVFFSDLIGYYRDMLVIKTAKNAAEYLELTETELTELQNDAARFTKEMLIWQSRVLDDAYIGMMKGTGSRRLIAEMTLIRLSDAKLDRSASALMARMAALEEKVENGVSLPPVKKAAPAPSPAPAEQTEEAPAAAEKFPEPEKLTPVGGFIEAVRKLEATDPGCASILKNAKAEYDGSRDRVILFVENAFCRSMLARDSVLASVASALSGVSGNGRITPEMIEIRIAQKPQADSAPDLDF